MATVKIEERIGVPVTQERLWEVLSNLEGWKNWNPLHPRIEGRLAIGATLTMDQVLPGQETETIQARVIDWIPYEQIHWTTSAGRGWVKTVRYLEIEPMTETSSVFSVGELFGGLLGGFAAKRLRPSYRAGFKAMCEALREEALKGAPPPEPAKPKLETKTASKSKAKPVAPKITADVVKAHMPKPLGMKTK